MTDEPRRGLLLMHDESEVVLCAEEPGRGLGEKPAVFNEPGLLRRSWGLRGRQGLLHRNRAVDCC